MSELDSIPTEIESAYYPDGITSHAAITGGEVNLTFSVTDVEGVKTILQRLSSVYDSTVSEDYEVVAKHLGDMGWEMAEAVKASNGNVYLPDSSGRLWRAFNYIESTPGSELEGDLEASAAVGGLLGSLHCSLASLDYQPKFHRADARDGGHRARRLEILLSGMPDSADRDLAVEMIALSRGEDVIAKEPSQIIHADPRIGNVLFREGKPLTFIDWDGYNRANPLVDVGDLLQSTIGEVLTKGSGSCSVAELYPLLEAYYEAAHISADKPTFTKQALAAARLIALDLGMRHLIDSVEDQYFVWDRERFASRLEFNIFCAQRQRRIYEVLQ